MTLEKLNKPVVFMTYMEIKEAVVLGFLEQTYGYDKDYNNPTPTILWAEKGYIPHQNNRDISVWSDKKYIKLLQKSVMWGEVKKEHFKSVSFNNFLKENSAYTYYTHNCRTENQRWPNYVIHKYYKGIAHLMYNVTPERWIADAFDWNNNRDSIDWESLNTEWCNIVGNTEADIVWSGEDE